MIGIFAGEPGVRKSTNGFYFPDPIVCFDMENRNEPLIKRRFATKIINNIKCKKLNPQTYQEDYLLSFNELENNLKSLIKNDQPETIMIDGISDIRNNYAVAKWIDNWKTGYYGKKLDRKKPATKGDWAQVNDIVFEVLTPIVNFSREKNINLIFTAQLKDDYKTIEVIENDNKIFKEAKTGRIPNYKDWIGYNLDTLVTIEFKNNKFTAICTKSLDGMWTQELDNTTLWDIFQKRQI